MNPTPYLVFQGNCREALEFYAEIFGAEIEMMMTADQMPGYDIPEGNEKLIAHGTVEFPDGHLMASDDIMGGGKPMAGSSIHLALPSTAEGQTAFDRLAEEGEVEMPYQKTFWSPGFGTLRDKFGINWMISTSEPMAD